ncbi:MAG: anthranilate synthase component I family protein, partial [Terriglobales bacterium]
MAATDHLLSLADVRRLAADYNLIPLQRTLLADLNTPVAAYLNCLRGRRSPYSYLLESVEGGEKIGRYSYLGVDPDLLVRQQRGRLALRRLSRSGPQPWQPASGSLWELLRSLAQNRRLAPVPGAPPFLAGAVGFLGYDMVRSLERLPARARNDLGLDDALLMFFSRQVIFDHVRREITLVACVSAEPGADLEAEYELACADLRDMEARLARSPRLPSSKPETGPLPVQPNWDRAAFEAAVRRIKQYIEAGDAFQVVLSQRFALTTGVDPFQVYRALRTINPSPYMFFLRMGTVVVVGASPELLVQVNQDKLQYRPIAGTRPRGASDAQDAELAVELLADEKERA